MYVFQRIQARSDQIKTLARCHEQNQDEAKADEKADEKADAYMDVGVRATQEAKAEFMGYK